MSTPRRPGSRRHSPAVYRRRRLTVLLALVAVVVLVWVTVRSCTAGPAEPAAASGSPSASASTAPATARPATPSATPSTGTSATATVTPTTSPTVSLPPWTGGDCALTVTARTDRTSYPAGTIPQLGLTITNRDSADCRVDVGTAFQKYVVRSGSDRVWVSTDCQAAAASDIVTISGGKSLSATLPWQRVRSAKGCPAGLPAPGAGTYTLRVSLGEHTSKPVVFRLG